MAAAACDHSAGWLARPPARRPGRWHPVAGFGRARSGARAAALAAESRGGRRSTRVSLVGGVALPTAAWLERRARAPRAARLVVAALVVWTALGGRSLERAALRLGDARRGGRPRATPAALARPSSGAIRPQLDAAELCRAAVESVAENTSDAVVAPLLWARARSACPARRAYRAVNTLDAMVGHRSERYRSFGWAAARARRPRQLAGRTPHRARSRSRWRRSSAATAGCAWRAACARRRRAIRARTPAGSKAPSRARSASGSAALNRYAHGLEQRPMLGNGPPPTARRHRPRRPPRRALVGASAVVALRRALLDGCGR